VLIVLPKGRSILRSLYFVNLWLNMQARIARNPIAEQGVPKRVPSTTTPTPKSSTSTSGNRNAAAATFASNANPAVTPSQPKGTDSAPAHLKYRLCKGEHYLDACADMKAMSLADRMGVVKKKGLCMACLRWGHMRKDCKRKKTGEVCKRAHPTMLHDYSFKCTPTATVHRVVDIGSLADVSDGECSCSHSLIVPVLLHHARDPNHSKIVYALLDGQSDACFVNESVLDQKLVVSVVHPHS
jgi:hypothetical protein